MKLTADLLQTCPQHFNPAKEWTLNLRSLQINMIENLGATMDQFDCFDFSDNDIRKLDGFPYLNRLKTILLCNNRVCRIDERLHEALPNLTYLNLINNNVEELGDLDPLAQCKNLEQLTLLRNNVANRRSYRDYVIYKLPSLKVLDFRRIKPQERDAVRKMFKGKSGRNLLALLGKKSGAPVALDTGPGSEMQQSKQPALLRTDEELESIDEAIRQASSLDEVERLRHMLQAGQLPQRMAPPPQPVNGAPQFVEEHDDDDDEE